MSIDKEWEKSRDNALGIQRQINGLLKCLDWHLPANLDQPVTQEDFDALVRWENELFKALDAMKRYADDLIVSEHIQIEKVCKEETSLKEVLKPVGFDQGVSR